MKVPSKIIDREAIIRFVQRDKAKEAGAEMISDYQKIEADALIDYADYLAEVVLTPDSAADTGWSFMVSVKSVNDGRVIAMFKSQAMKPNKKDAKESWVATSGGYEKQITPDSLTSPMESGEQLAYEMMSELIKIWR